MTERGLTYNPECGHSYFRDLILTELGREAPRGADERLAAHKREMDVHIQRREAKATRQLRAAGFEYRVEPNTTQGQGGYFAPPLWLNELFATANRPKRVLADLIPACFPMPAGVSSINLPIISTGSIVQPTPPATAVPDQDIVDATGASNVVGLSGMVQAALQLLEQSPHGAHLDWAFFTDLSEAYDAELEGQLLYGAGSASSQILGVANVASNVQITYTSGSPTQQGLWPTVGQAMSQIGDGRDLPPECLLMRTARWGWMLAAVGTDNIPFGILQPGFLGSEPDVPNPIGGLYGLPVFLDDAIPQTVTFGSTISYGSATNQDLIVALRPSDLILFEGNPSISVGDVFAEPLSGALGVTIRLHDYAASITNRRPAGIAVIGGTGLKVQTSY